MCLFVYQNICCCIFQSSLTKKLPARSSNHTNHVNGKKTIYIFQNIQLFPFTLPIRSSEVSSFWIKNEKNSDEWPTKVNGNRPCFLVVMGAVGRGRRMGAEDSDMHQSSTFNAHV
jgi:hypothetical protein